MIHYTPRVRNCPAIASATSAAVSLRSVRAESSRHEPASDADASSVEVEITFGSDCDQHCVRRGVPRIAPIGSALAEQLNLSVSRGAS